MLDSPQMLLLPVLACVLAFVPAMLALAFLLGRLLERRLPAPVSRVSEQHVEVFRSGVLDEAAIESAKQRLSELLDHGDMARVEAQVQPGEQFLFHVHALAEIGTERAGLVLERLLHHRLSPDRVEQSWYWIDLASCLRRVDRQTSLPHLLRCGESPMEAPLSHFFAAETVCFSRFPDYLRDPDAPLGRSALRMLHRALEGLRLGVQPQFVSEARLGELFDALAEGHTEPTSPLLARVYAEGLRLLRRAPHARRALEADSGELDLFESQISLLQGHEPLLRSYLRQAPRGLKRQLATAEPCDLRDLLAAILDLKVDAGTEILSLLRRGEPEVASAAIEALRWSPGREIGAYLRGLAASNVDLARRARRRTQAYSPLAPSLPDLPYHEILRSLRGHPGRETEHLLLLAARDWDPSYRAQAFGSLGWWEPLSRTEVLACLNTGRRDLNQEVRLSARAALARLGERAALHWFRQALFSQQPHLAVQAMYCIWSEGLTLLWPELDHVAESENQEIAHYAREALERLSEDLHPLA